MNKIKSSVFSLIALSALSTGCMDVAKELKGHKNKKKNINTMITNSPSTNEIRESEGEQIQIISETQLKLAALNKSIISISNPKIMSILNELPQSEAAPSVQKAEERNQAQQKNQTKNLKNDENLYVGFPISLIGEQSVFGGVITKVTDKENESLGTLKLTDLSPIHVRTTISRLENGAPAVTLVGCFDACTESSQQIGLVNIPIVGFNQQTGMLVLDMASIGKELDLISMLDPTGAYTQLKAISSDTVAVDFDLKTLIFDIKTKMVPVTSGPTDPEVKNPEVSTPPTETTDFTVRWYLKLSSGFNPAFEAKAPTPGVGFFTTQRGSKTRITRFSAATDVLNGSPVKYYIKNVPEEFKPAFQKALNDWNKEFKALLGKNLISYEFINATDERASQLVPGDIRYNIIEWDLENKASYGGLGPSIANQHSGETMSANVLIQGPTIVKIYTEWFGVSKKAQELKAEGKTAQANLLIKNFEKKVSAELESRNKSSFKLKLGKYLEMNINAQRPELEDPIKKGSFEIVPAGMSYEQYMKGYMHEIVAHEIGHNLGLRHNFKGNLGAQENLQEPGSVSRSVMEYLGRPFRHLNTIGDYDRMAIAFGYADIAPTKLNWFCTDEDQGTDALSLTVKSPECTKSDATSDPFSFWETRLNRILDLLLERKSPAAPVWALNDVKAQLDEVITGLAAYALSAEATGDTWTNFFGKNGRPSSKSEVKKYVLERLKNRICNPALVDEIAAKESEDARKLAQENLDALRKFVVEKTDKLNLYKAEDLSCL